VATFQAAVRRALSPEQQDLIDHAEHCSADPEALAAIGRASGHQVRVRLAADPNTFALYTVSETRDETPDSLVRMGPDGRARLGDGNEFAAVVDSVVPRAGLDDADAERLHEFVERLNDDGTHRGLIVLAPHGGDIEPHTDTQADRVADLLADYDVTSWRCKGFGPRDGGAARVFHITSTDIHEASFPALASVIGRRFRYAVAFHGFRDEEILVGGGAPFRLRAEIAAEIERAVSGSGIPVRIAGPDDVFGGDSPRNIVNRLTANRRNGIHIEQSLRARAEHGIAIADAVAAVFAPRLDACLPQPRRSIWSLLRKVWCAIRHLFRGDVRTRPSDAR
jgi:phage replication-related protein YjqB (UPF0714/DUF867 family)